MLFHSSGRAELWASRLPERSIFRVRCRIPILFPGFPVDGIEHGSPGSDIDAFVVYSRAGLDVAVQSVGNPIERAVCQADGVEFSVAAACIDIAVCYCRAGYNGVIRVEFPTGGTLFLSSA